MINYIDTKNRQGVFFEPPTERIHLPDSAETYMTRSVEQSQSDAFITILLTNQGRAQARGGHRRG